MKTDFTTGVTRGAVISECGKFRYLLTREWDESLPLFVFCLLNPSKANALIDDPTVKKGIGFTRRLGGGRMWFVNLFGFRTTYPSELLKAADARGPDNDKAIADACRHADKIVLAWGGVAKRWEAHARWVTRNIKLQNPDRITPTYCLGRTKDGQPRHPLMLAYDTPLEVYP